MHLEKTMIKGKLQKRGSWGNYFSFTAVTEKSFLQYFYIFSSNLV